MGFNTNETLNGTDGKLWINDTLCASIKSFTLKQKNVFETIDKAGQLTSSRRLVGIELTGTISKFKIDNSIAGIMKEYADGNPPEIKLIGLLENKTTGLIQRAIIKGVTFDELDIINFEQKKVIVEDIPYEAESYSYQDLT
ncbi:MAG: hypothetical protein J6Q89_02540 [Clostridia bacterium]|nr:hypothetical protein [Clostridia bacterium]